MDTNFGAPKKPGFVKFIDRRVSLKIHGKMFITNKLCTDLKDFDTQVTSFNSISPATFGSTPVFSKGKLHRASI